MSSCRRIHVATTLTMYLWIWTGGRSASGLISFEQQQRRRRRLRHPQISSPLAPTVPNTRPAETILFANNSNKHVSAADKERRDEEKRRRERKEDVVIGKTSAVHDAKDYAMDTAATEETWMRQASSVEQQVFRQTERGMHMLRMLRLQEAADAFDQVFSLRPNAYLWQAGIVRFYQNEVHGAAEIFALNAALYESRFGEPASEERIWRDACQLKLYHTMDKKGRKLMDDQGDLSTIVPQVPDRDEITHNMLPTERRKVLRITRELFQATVEKDPSKEVLARAKLRTIGGSRDEPARVDRKMWKLNAWFYLGLHYDVIGEEQESKDCMKMALRLCPSSSGDDIIHTLPMLHMATRDWFDDEAFEEDSDSDTSVSLQDDNSSTMGNLTSRTGSQGSQWDPVFIDSIRKSVSKMKFTQLTNALRARGLKSNGSKEVLADKLFNSLLEDVGLD